MFFFFIQVGLSCIKACHFSDHVQLGSDLSEESVRVQHFEIPEDQIQTENDPGRLVALIARYKSQNHAHKEEEQGEQLDHVQVVGEEADHFGLEDLALGGVEDAHLVERERDHPDDEHHFGDRYRQASRCGPIGLVHRVEVAEHHITEQDQKQQIPELE